MSSVERGANRKPSSIKEALLDPESIEEIDLGEVAKIADDLRKKTKIDPNHKEEFFIERESIPTSFNMKVGDKDIQGPDLSKNALFVTILRSDNTESPHSLGDIIPILSNGHEEKRCVLKVTPGENSLIVAGSKTPSLGPDEMHLFLRKLNRKLKQNEEAYSKLKGAAAKNKIFFNGIVNDCGLVVFKGPAGSQKISKATA